MALTRIHINIPTASIMMRDKSSKGHVYKNTLAMATAFSLSSITVINATPGDSASFT